MAKRRGKRVRFYVIPAKGEPGWDVKRGKRKIAWSPLKAGAVAYGRKMAKQVEGKVRLSRLIVYRADGRIHYEHTYGEDPRRYVG